ncbi:MAG TPA: hypothetical protein VFF73_14565 [Planctomycetota bacterium]|nr:hypothetical protein [Planctomycetota bacterium]
MDEETNKTCEELMLALAQRNQSVFMEMFDTPLETAPGYASYVVWT